ncbi:hypothetical protein PHMEG_00028721 [Phytophthora megakarya]|uniref:Uncharacterized protein n=1 Tax=Phytophthora megakarya TaxID=4795 RepID=A0A225V5G9_9STRA|nr:hypothetical protein PHMEG_00028721 [Phytophthora megakarya]
MIAASAYLEVTTVNMAEYNGMNNGDSLVALLNRHRELTAKLQSVRYRHVVREYAATDSLAGKALESNVSKVVLNDHRKSELKEFSRIQEMIYESSSDENKVMKSESENFVQIAQGITRQASVPSGEIAVQGKTFTDFVPRIAAMTRSQARKGSKRVHFEDDLEDSGVEAETEAETLADNSQVEPQRTNAEAQHSPNADDIEPVIIQEERRRRISEAQDEELRWSMLKAILRGETTKMSYKEARDAWKWFDKFGLSSDNILYYVGPNRRKSEDDQPELSLRLYHPRSATELS